VVVSQYLKFIGGLSLIHDRFGSYPNAVFNIPQAAGGSIQTTGDATDNRLPYTPDWTANVGADYTIPLPRGSIKINATYLHNDGFYSEVDNFRRQGAFNFLNSSVTWTSPSERYNLAFWGKNLLNDAVVSQLGGTAAGTIATYQPPRTYGVTVGAKF
jgi:iron complex outermembrane recepter protein